MKNKYRVAIFDHDIGDQNLFLETLRSNDFSNVISSQFSHRDSVKLLEEWEAIEFVKIEDHELFSCLIIFKSNFEFDLQRLYLLFSRVLTKGLDIPVECFELFNEELLKLSTTRFNDRKISRKTICQYLANPSPSLMDVVFSEKFISHYLTRKASVSKSSGLTIEEFWTSTAKRMDYDEFDMVCFSFIPICQEEFLVELTRYWSRYIGSVKDTELDGFFPNENTEILSVFSETGFDDGYGFLVETKNKFEYYWADFTF